MIRASSHHDLLHRPGFLLRKAHQVAVAIFHDEIGALELTPPQHNVLSAILAHPGSHQVEISRRVGYDRATVGTLLLNLDARKLIRRRSSLDRRVRTLHITAAGRRLLDASIPAMVRINRKILAPLASSERDLFVALLAKIALSKAETRLAAAGP